MTHIQPKEIVTVQYIGEERTRFTPFIGGEKIDIKPNEKIEMDARQAAVVLVDHLNWKKISENTNEVSASTSEAPQKEAEPKKAKKK